MRASLLLAVLVAGCGSDPAPTPPPDTLPTACTAAPCGLFDRLDAFQLDGLAARIADAPEAEFVTDWTEDFADDPGGRTRGEGLSFDGTLQIAGKGDPAVWISPAIPLAADREYRLAWRSTWDNVIFPRRTPRESAGVAVRFYKVKEPADDRLADAKAAEKARIQAHRSADWRPAEGRAPWHDEERFFRRPRAATHMQIRVAGGRALNRKSPAVVSVDDLVLQSRAAPAWTSRKHDVWAEPGAHPLAKKARSNSPAHRKAKEIREVVLAPAPSTLRTRIAVPEGGRLALGYGLTPGRGTKPVEFEAAIVAGDRRTVVLDGKAKGSYRTPFQDVDLDLTAWAGQTVTLELSTRGDAPPEDLLEALARQPEARAVWTTGRLRGAGTGKLAVLVLLDTLGARHASGWGATRDTTPQLQRIAADGTHYERALAPSPWTLPSIASYLTGLTPDAHGAGQKLGNDHWDRRPVLPSFDTLAERLRTVGWDTRGWVNNPFLAPRNSALDQGFLHYVDYGTRSEKHAAKPAIGQVLEDLKRPGNDDRFVLLHLLDPHGPYTPDADHAARFMDPDYDGKVGPGTTEGGFRDILNRRVKPTEADKQALRDLHHGVVAYADTQVGRVFDAAKATGRDLLFVVTSDHGEEFWEHGRFEHGHSVYDELLHVPLLTWQSGGSPGRVAGAVDARGVFGSVLDFAGVEHPGTPSLPSAGAAPVFASPTLYGRRQRAAERDGWKYVLVQPQTGAPHRRVGPLPRQALYELRSDPKEERNRLRDAPERARALHTALTTEALQGFPGAWVVVAGADTSVELLERDGPGWHGDVHDFPWPREDGRALGRGTLEVERTQEATVSRIALSVGHGPTILVLEPRADGGAVTAVPGAGTAATAPGAVEADGRLELADGAIRTPATELLATAGSIAPGSLFIARLPGDVRPRGRDEAPDAADVEALRSLGYME